MDPSVHRLLASIKSTRKDPCACDHFWPVGFVSKDKVTKAGYGKALSKIDMSQFDEAPPDEAAAG